MRKVPPCVCLSCCPSFGTCLASVVHELVQRLEDAAPLARPDAADGRRHRRLGEVGDVLGQLLLFLRLHRRRFVWWVAAAILLLSFPNDVAWSMVRSGQAGLLACFPPACLPPSHFKASKIERPRGYRYAGHRGQRDTHYLLPLVVSLSSLRPVCEVVDALCTRMLAGW